MCVCERRQNGCYDMNTDIMLALRGSDGKVTCKYETVIYGIMQLLRMSQNHIVW